MADRYTQPMLDDDSSGREPRSERSELIMLLEEEGRMRFNCGGHSGYVDLGWYADGEDSPWTQDTEADVYDDDDDVDADQVEACDPEPPEYPQWLDLELATYYSHHDPDRLVVRPHGPGELREPNAVIGEYDTLDSQRAFRVITVAFDAHRDHPHKPEQRWIYWQKIEPNQVGELDGRVVRDIVQHATRVVAHAQLSGRQDSFATPSGVTGICLMRDHT